MESRTENNGISLNDAAIVSGDRLAVLAERSHFGGCDELDLALGDHGVESSGNTSTLVILRQTPVKWSTVSQWRVFADVQGGPLHLDEKRELEAWTKGLTVILTILSQNLRTKMAPNQVVCRNRSSLVRRFL